MKVCEYCFSEVTDDVMQCKSCGSKEFKNICANCGEKFSGTVCPNCGVVVGEKPRTCYNCGKATYQKICPDCGADLVNRKLNRPNNINANISNNQTSHQTKKQYGCLKAIYTAFIVFGVFFSIIFSIANMGSTSKNEATVQKNLSDMEIITLEGHPKFFDDYKKAKSFWKEYKKVKVTYEGDAPRYRDALLLMASDEVNGGKISNIRIYFSNSSELKDKMTVNDALKIVCQYIPYDIIEKYYTFDKSFHEKYFDGSYEAFHYVMQLNKEGISANLRGPVCYDSTFSFKIVHSKDDGWFAQMGDLAYAGRYNEFIQDKCKLEKWNVDLKKFK